ncbi:hypothetical protein MA16_Dca004882 [Dendrobium catenatum]|uniref:Uncharacterized protein n=1 Tax=Dendrobium catenatum TaxID=906689 RepID=A0A2I0WGA9_9ASPA|nr:hypothetical protein MA16_Dca004882 [Dendrobium catenatum]
MRIFSWVQSKLNGKQGSRFDVGPSSSHYTTKRNSCRQEFKDFPQTFLAIGTFGNNDLQEDSQMAQSSYETLELLHKISDLNIEEVIKLQQEISKLLCLQQISSTGGADFSLNNSLNSSLTLEADNISSLKICKESKDDSDDSKITLNKLKDLLSDNHNGIRQRSLSFLLKKMFISRSCLSTQQSLRNSISESKVEKILRKIIHKKIHPQTVPRPPSMKYLQKNKEEEKVEDGCKWIKTDSEYIVLEI